MRVEGNIQLYGEWVKRALESARRLGPGSAALGSVDQSELSEPARSLQAYREAIAVAPDIRGERVQLLSQAIEEGSYLVPGREVALKMLLAMRLEPAF